MKHANEPPDGGEAEGSHWVPCSEHVRLREGVSTFRAIAYAAGTILLGVDVYLWQRIDGFEKGAMERAIAISEIRRDLTYLVESQRRVESMVESHVQKTPPHGTLTVP